MGSTLPDPAFCGMDVTLDAVMDRAGAIQALLRFTADVDPRNAASFCLFDRLGFHGTDRQERTWLVGEQWCDSVYLALDRDLPALAL